MIQIRSTKKLIDLLGLKDSDLFPITPAENRLGSWYSNIFKIGRYNNIIFVNEKTLFSFVVLRITKKDLQNFQTVFVNNLTDALEFVNFNQREIISIANECNSAFQFTKTVDKKILGTMCELTFHYQYFLHDGASLHEALMHANNNYPHKNLTSNSIEALLNLTAR